MKVLNKYICIEVFSENWIIFMENLNSVARLISTAKQQILWLGSNFVDLWSGLCPLPVSLVWHN